MDPADSADDTADVSKRLQLVSNKLATTVPPEQMATPVATPGPATGKPSETGAAAEADAEAVEMPPGDFAAVISQIKLLLFANPLENDSVENRKIMRVIKRKFKSLLNDQKDSFDEVKKQATMAIAEQIAIWVETILKEAETLGSSSTLMTVKSEEPEEPEEDTRVWPVLRKRSSIYEVTSQDSFYLVRNLKHQTEEEWQAWVTDALNTAEEWSYWISATCADLGEKGEMLSAEEESRAMSPEEFKAWRNALGEESTKKIRKAREVREGKEHWIGNVPVPEVRVWGRFEREEPKPNFVGPTCDSEEDALNELKEQVEEEGAA